MDLKRRRITALLALAAAAAPLHALAAPLPTPRQSRGPFYPERLPLDHDNDLVRVAGREGVARGRITELGGRVLDAAGRPVAGARVEIWQCDANGRYHHPQDRQGFDPDPDFQGYGHFVTDDQGGYRFRTIRPVAYPGRAPHIHMAVHPRDGKPLVTQLYVEGAPENAHDFLLNRIDDPAARQRLIVPFAPATGEAAATAELAARFDVVLA